MEGEWSAARRIRRHKRNDDDVHRPVHGYCACDSEDFIAAANSEEQQLTLASTVISKHKAKSGIPYIIGQ